MAKRLVAKKLIENAKRLRKCINRETFFLYLDPSIHQSSRNYVLFSPSVFRSSPPRSSPPVLARFSF